MEDSSIPKQILYAVECINTNRSIKEYFRNLKLKKEDLEKHEVILDIGSGIEQKFARDCKEMGLKNQIISIDPGIIFPQNQDLRYLTTKDYIEKRMSARKNPIEGTISAISQHLPFKNNSFDMVLALYSVPLHLFQKGDVSLTLTEILRVLKSNGEARIYPVTKDFRNEAVEDFIQKHQEVKFEKIESEIDPESYLFVFTKTNQFTS